MTDAERAKWNAARAHARCALRLLAALDDQTDGQQQFVACVLSSEMAHIVKAISSLATSPRAPVVVLGTVSPDGKAHGSWCSWCRLDVEEHKRLGCVHPWEGP